MKVRIIVKKDGCEICKGYMSRLDLAKFKYEILDAEDPAYQKLYDEWKIDVIPVVQIVADDDAGTLLYQFPAGTWSPRAITKQMELTAVRLAKKSD